MKLTTAEEFESELGKACLKWILDNNPANTETFRNQIRQIQANALRFAASVIVDTGLPENEYSKDRIDYVLDLLRNEANQLHPLPEGKRQQGTPTGPPPEDPIPELTDSQKEITKHFI